MDTWNQKRVNPSLIQALLSWILLEVETPIDDKDCRFFAWENVRKPCPVMLATWAIKIQVMQLHDDIYDLSKSLTKPLCT